MSRLFCLYLILVFIISAKLPIVAHAQNQRQPAAPPTAKTAPAIPIGSEQRASDAVADAQSPRQVEKKRPEQQVTDHDRSERFSGKAATPSSPAFKNQAKQGRITGFDLYVDPLGVDHPGMTLKEIFENDRPRDPRSTPTSGRCWRVGMI